VSGPGTALATGGIAAHVYVTGGGGTVDWIGVGGRLGAPCSLHGGFRP